MQILGQSYFLTKKRPGFFVPASSFIDRIFLGKLIVNRHKSLRFY